MLKIEVICKPCRKCELFIERVNNILRCMETKGKMKIRREIIFSKDFRKANKYGYYIERMPVIFINGNIEFVGHVKEESLIRFKLEQILRG